MARKNVLNPHKLVDAVSMGASFTSSPTSIRSTDNVAIQIIPGAGGTGTFTLEGTVDGTDWTTITLGTAMTISGSATTFLVDMNQLSFDQIRIVYTRTSGTGTVNAWIMFKQVGG